MLASRKKICLPATLKRQVHYTLVLLSWHTQLNRKERTKAQKPKTRNGYKERERETATTFGRKSLVEPLFLSLSLTPVWPWIIWSEKKTPAIDLRDLITGTREKERARTFREKRKKAIIHGDGERVFFLSKSSRDLWFRGFPFDSSPRGLFVCRATRQKTYSTFVEIGYLKARDPSCCTIAIPFHSFDSKVSPISFHSINACVGERPPRNNDIISKDSR